MAEQQLTCIAIDDEPLALKLLQQYAAQTPALKLLHVFGDALSAAEYLKTHPVDLLFVDINMPEFTGIDLVRSLNNKPQIIFTTAYKKFAFEGFELDAVDYLLKPIGYPRFVKAIEKAQQARKQSPVENSSATLVVRSAYQLVKINVDDIEYIEALEDYIRIHLSNDKPVMPLLTLKSILEKLPRDRFIRIHRSYIVPFSKIRSLVNRKLVLFSSKELPVSDSYINPLNEWLRGSR